MIDKTLRARYTLPRMARPKTNGSDDSFAKIGAEHSAAYRRCAPTP